ncbi:MAG TPA: methyltransferase [Steroidobacteraceae bacterium]|nr:methyltransferase [Steroidobacteraceae bacterium]
MSAPAASANFQVALSLLNHKYLNPILGALVRRGIPDHLAHGPAAASELARRAGLNALAVTRALRALAAFGAFQEVSPGVFANTVVSDLFRNQSGGLHNFALYNSSDHHVRSAAALGQSLVSGRSASEQVFGESFWEYARRHPEQNATFNRALAELRGEEHQQIADAYDWAQVGTVVDVGGGIGSLLAAIMTKHSGVCGVLLEQPELLSDADRLLTARGLRQRCELLPGDFLDAIAARGDVWILCQVLHDWSDAQCRMILQRCREAMRASDRLLVVEMLTVPCAPNMQVALIDLVMLMYFGEARQRTVPEYNELFESTHFALTRVLPTAGAFSIVEASPA